MKRKLSHISLFLIGIVIGVTVTKIYFPKIEVVEKTIKSESQLTKKKTSEEKTAAKLSSISTDENETNNIKESATEKYSEGNFPWSQGIPWSSVKKLLATHKDKSNLKPLNQDLSISDDFVALFGMSEEERDRINGKVLDSVTKIKDFEKDKFVELQKTDVGNGIEGELEPGKFAFKLPKLPSHIAHELKEGFENEVSEILGSERGEMFLELSNERFSELFAYFGEAEITITFEINQGAGILREKFDFVDSEPGHSIHKPTAFLAHTNEDLNAPFRYDHLFEIVNEKMEDEPAGSLNSE